MTPPDNKKIQPNRASRLAGYRQLIYTNVLFYYIDIQKSAKRLNSHGGGGGAAICF